MITTAIYITIPLLLEALAKHLNQPYEKLQEYYDTSKAFREYVTSLRRDFEGDIENKIFKTTPSTTPRFDVPWMLEQLKKKQNEIFNIKQQLATNEIEVERAQRAEFKEPPKLLTNKDKITPIEGRGGKRGRRPSAQQIKDSQEKRDKFKEEHGYLTKDEFLKKKAEDVRKANLKTIDLNHKIRDVANRPLRNDDLRYKTYTERIHNAQRHKKKTDEK